MEKNSNNLIKTIIFVVIVAITCLIFFGLNESDKTDVQLVSFGFILFAEFAIYASILLSTIFNERKLNSADIISTGVLYAIGSFLINTILNINEMRPLIIYNIIAILIYIALLSSVILIKKK